MKKTNKKYYDGSKLLSMKDINGERPEIFICSTNRTGGKTTWFGKYVVNKFLKRGEKFGLIYRYSYELTNIADKFFKDIGNLFFKDYVMTSQMKEKTYVELYLQHRDDEDSKVLCGYAICINKADAIKKMSHLFSDISVLLFDEFQPESNTYLNNEVEKLMSIHTSLARGQGEQAKYLPIIFISNPVTIINPYYVSLGISKRLRSDTKFLRGEGFIMEQGYVESASNAQMESAFNRAFKKENYLQYSAQAIYLNDSSAFIERPTGKSRYYCTLKYKGVEYGIREYNELGIIYCDDKPDTSFKSKICVTTEDHNINYVMLKNSDYFISMLRYYFERGCFRFKDLKCKEAILTALSY